MGAFIIKKDDGTYAWEKIAWIAVPVREYPPMDYRRLAEIENVELPTNYVAAIRDACRHNGD